MTPEEQERQRQEWQQELTKVYCVWLQVVVAAATVVVVVVVVVVNCLILLLVYHWYQVLCDVLCPGCCTLLVSNIYFVAHMMHIWTAADNMYFVYLWICGVLL
jgi:hypothetical protein